MQRSGWLPAARNRGHAYRDRVSAPAASVLGFYVSRYGHSGLAVWTERLAAGEIWCNGQQLRADGPLASGDRLEWHRPPWWEAAVPVLSEGSIVFDDGDLLVLNKPSGLPVLPAGGFLEHTLLAQLEDLVAGQPRPVHRLGRFTSGLLVCARRSHSRAWLSAQLRESTVQAAEAQLELSAPAPAPGSCRKVYRAITQPLPADWRLGETRPVTVAIGRQAHPLLVQVWAAAESAAADALPSRSLFTLLERRADGCLLEVAIASGRPHQIRIHAAALGAPLQGDPLYAAGGAARPQALPGDPGYQLHAHRLRLRPPGGEALELQAEPPPALLGLLESQQP